MELSLKTEQVCMYAHIVSVLGEQFCTYMDGVFYFNFGMQDFVDEYGIIFDTVKNEVYIEDAAWDNEQLQKVYLIVGYAKYHGISVAGSGM